jgi:hypothetical protein|tara:strand:+ start:346 stop:483 length:138 start_codon:yes stop_codon:yes gene_type:complete
MLQKTTDGEPLSAVELLVAAAHTALRSRRGRRRRTISVIMGHPTL